MAICIALKDTVSPTSESEARGWGMWGDMLPERGTRERELVLRP